MEKNNEPKKNEVKHNADNKKFINKNNSQVHRSKMSFGL